MRNRVTSHETPSIVGVRRVPPSPSRRVDEIRLWAHARPLEEGDSLNWAPDRYTGRIHVALGPDSGQDRGRRRVRPARGGAASGYTRGVTLYRVYHRRFEAYHHPDGRKGVMATWDRAATWDDRAQAEAVAADLNQRDRQAEYGHLGEDDWIVVDDREPPRAIT
jgi:hypothetical protein